MLGGEDCFTNASDERAGAPGVVRGERSSQRRRQRGQPQQPGGRREERRGGARCGGAAVGLVVAAVMVVGMRSSRSDGGGNPRPRIWRGWREIFAAVGDVLAAVPSIHTHVFAQLNNKA